jgi:hypothetical protein
MSNSSPASRHAQSFIATILAQTLLCGACYAQSTGGQPQPPLILGTNVKQHADAVLAIMTYTTVPDVTTSSLSINNGATGNPGFGQTQLGGGFTISRTFPLYLEGTVAYSRYDPTFVATEGTQQRPLPAKWNTASTTIGIGWDFAITDELKFRPILNGTLGRVASDLRIAQTVINQIKDTNLEFLQDGVLDAYGYGGSLVLDYEHYREKYEIDVELRATDIYLRSFGASSAAQPVGAMAGSHGPACTRQAGALCAGNGVLALLRRQRRRTRLQ